MAKNHDMGQPLIEIFGYRRKENNMDTDKVLLVRDALVATERAALSREGVGSREQRAAVKKLLTVLLGREPSSDEVAWAMA